MRGGGRQLWSHEPCGQLGGGRIFPCSLVSRETCLWVEKRWAKAPVSTGAQRLGNTKITISWIGCEPSRVLPTFPDQGITSSLYPSLVHTSRGNTNPR